MTRPARRACSAASNRGCGPCRRGSSWSPDSCRCRSGSCWEKDVAVTLRDGVTIYVDVLRPAGTEKVPVIVAWSPYGKSRGSAQRYMQIFELLGMDTHAVSGLMRFEGPDPAFWCAHGYAVCNPDPRGSFNSEGDIRVWSRYEGEDYHDLIEWLGVQDWCSGKVGLSGNSYLAISQWFAAAEQPPHLAAIAPWEGMSDIYRDLVMRGGIPDFPFPRQLSTSFVGKNRREDLVAEAEQHPLVDEFWASKIPAFDKITVPAYVVASYSNSIHTPGTFRGWRRIASTEKWLRIHNTMEWPDYYEEPYLNDLLRFFDHFLKGVDNGWRETPRVRYAVMDLEGHDRINLPAAAFPPEDVRDVRYYLDAASGALSAQAPGAAATASYDAEAEEGRAVFTVRVDQPTEFVGYPKVRLWVEADGSDDMDLFVFLQKLNAEGQPLEQFNVPNHGPIMQGLTQRGAAILKYKGSNGRPARVHAPPGRGELDGHHPGPQLRPRREARARRDRLRRRRLVPDRAGARRRRTAAPCPYRPPHLRGRDAGSRQRRVRQPWPPRHPYRRGLRVLSSASHESERCGLIIGIRRQRLVA